MSEGTILVTGAGGFLGGHLVAELLRSGRGPVRAVDLKPEQEWFQRFRESDNRRLDLRLKENCEQAVEGVTTVYNFASDMGGMGFIEAHKADCMLSVLINTHLLQASLDAPVERFLFASSACVYPAERQASPEVVPLREDDVYPADPEDGYGWEKLFGERMCRHFSEEFGLVTRVIRYHNVYGPHGTFSGGREKAPAAICRKVAEAVLGGEDEIEVWGDGRQARSFTYIDDAIKGTLMIMDSSLAQPVNVGSAEVVTIDRMIDIVERIAGVRVERRYNLEAPQGVRGRNSDNTLIRRELGWEPDTPLSEGLGATYRWIHDQLASKPAAARVGGSTT